MDWGHCALSEEGCVPADKKHCRASWGCRLKGRCSLDGDRCVVKRDRDCKRSELCKYERKCEARKGRCVKRSASSGMFTTSGLLVKDLPSAAGILSCWLVGGVAALCGALAYAELGAALPSNGGEYHFLARLMHPSVGFVSAWSSLIVGFSAPLAAVALAFGSYLGALVPGLDARISGGVLIVVLSALHMWRVSAGAGFQNLFTAGKVLLIASFAVAGLALGAAGRLVIPAGPPLAQQLTSPGFAVGLLWVSFSYTGWNAAAYVAGEVRDPARVLPRALVAGTALVTVLYLALNAAFFAAAPLSALAGKVEVGHVAAQQLFGERGATLVSLVISLGLVSTVGALIVTGPRVSEAVGRDFPRLRILATRHARGGPVVAIGLQAALALAMMLSASFEQLLIYIGFTLSMFAGLTVAAVFVLRRRGIETPYRTPGHPFTTLGFIALMVWMIVHGVVQRPWTALAGFGTVASGLLVYLFSGGSMKREHG
jgi:APA family basic amino acid/polyamine antiporter